MLFIYPNLVGADPGSNNDFEGNPIWLIFGVLFVLLGLVFLSIAYRWPRHLLHVLNTQQATPMDLRVEVEEGSDSTQYYACLSNHSAGVDSKAWRVGLWAPSNDTRDLVGHELSALVYLDPQTAKPAVIEHAGGYLWAMKGAALPYPTSTRPGA